MNQQISKDICLICDRHDAPLHGKVFKEHNGADGITFCEGSGNTPYQNFLIFKQLKELICPTCSGKTYLLKDGTVEGHYTDEICEEPCELSGAKFDRSVDQTGHVFSEGGFSSVMRSGLGRA